MKNKFSRKIFADRDAYYMSVPEVAGRHIAKRLSGFSSAVDLCCAVGMLSIQLAKEIDKVYGVDIDEKRIESARKNAQSYGMDNIEFIHGDVLDVKLLKKIKAEVAIIDPDWSSAGDDKNQWVPSPDMTQPSWREMFNLTSLHITKNIVSRIPRDWSLSLMDGFGPCRIENIFLDNKLKFKTAYFLKDIKASYEENIYL